MNLIFAKLQQEIPAIVARYDISISVMNTDCT